MSDPISVVSLLCEAMAEQGKDAKTQVNHQDNFGQTSLHRAALRGATICSLNLLQVEKYLLTLVDTFVLIHQQGKLPETERNNSVGVNVIHFYVKRYDQRIDTPNFSQ